MLLFFFNDTATTEIYTLSYTTLFRSQRLGGVADEHRAHAHRGGGARESERIGAAAGGSDEAPGAPAELRLQPRERSEEHTSELQSQSNLVCRLLLEKKKSYTPDTSLL